jgi:two-component system cell cycle sensor histidine kinase/response regulator CckA
MGTTMTHAQKLEPTDASTAAHDLGRALAGVLGGIADYATRAVEATARLFSFGRVHQGDPHTIDANQILTAFRPALDRMVGPKVRVSYALEASAGRVPVSRGAFDQVLINLVVNARDAMPAGGQLTVSTSNEWRPRRRDRAGALPLVEFVVIRITDTGVGLGEDHTSRLLEPFFTRRVFGRSAGIGLRTAQSIATQAGGRIDVISAPDSGTTYRVLLPVHNTTTARR